MRVAAEQVIEAYKQTRLVPIRDTFLYRKHSMICGCALTALTCKKNVDFLEGLAKRTVNDLHLEDEIMSILELSIDYIDGFTRGFDGMFNIEGVRCINREDLEKGYEDGKTVWEAVKVEFNLEN